MGAPIESGRSSDRTVRLERSEQSMSNGLDGLTDVSLEVFSTCAQSSDGDRDTYAQRVADVARWSERAGCKGILVYSDNRLVDPWLCRMSSSRTRRACVPSSRFSPSICIRTPSPRWRRPTAICTGGAFT